MFGIRPTGFRSFSVTPRLAEGWNQMALRHIRAFGGDFDLEVCRTSADKLELRLTNHLTGLTKTFKLSSGATIRIKL